MPVRNHIDLVEKTLRVLEVLGESKDGANLKSIASGTGLVKSSAFRILFTLKELGYVEQAGANGPYRLNSKILAISRRVAAAGSLLEVARPHLFRLRDAVCESVWLGQLRQGKVVLVDAAEAQHALHLRYGMGDRCPMHATALGKAIAAHLPHHELKRILDGKRLRRFTPQTITRRSDLQVEFARVRRNDFAVNNEETTVGAIILGAPIFDAQGGVFAAVCVTIPTVRCSHQKRKVIIGFLKKTSLAITEDLAARGFRDPESGVSQENQGLRHN